MKSFTYLSIATVAALASAQDVDTSDYPLACSQFCAPVSARSSACDQNNNNGNDDDDDDDDDVNCICNGQGMSTAIPRCDACVAPFRIPGDDDYSDIQELLQACGLSTTSLSNAPTPTTTYTFTTTSTDDDGDQDVETITSFGAAIPNGAPTPITSVYTTTSTDDDGETEVETETTTFFSSLPGSFSSTVITTSSNGEAITTTKIASPTGANAGSDNDSSNNSPNAAPAQTAAPVLGAAALMAMGALAAL